MRLFEITINEAVDYTWKYDSSAEFKINGINYMVDFLPSFSGKDKEYTVEFQATQGPKFSNSGMMGQSSIQVFSTVIATIEEFINRENPEMLDFTAKKSENRVDLYAKLVNKFKSQLLQKGYNVSVENYEGETRFIITKKDN